VLDLDLDLDHASFGGGKDVGYDGGTRRNRSFELDQRCNERLDPLETDPRKPWPMP